MLPLGNSTSTFRVLVLVIAEDGVEDLNKLLRLLPSGLPVTLVAGLLQEAEAVLAGTTSRLWHVVEHGKTLRTGSVYLVLSSLNVMVSADGRCTVTAHLHDGEPEAPLDLFLSSLAESFGSEVLVVVLGGPGQDGLTGLRTLKKAGATVIVQWQPQPQLSPRLAHAATEDGVADLILPSATLAFVVADLLTYGRDWTLHRIRTLTGLQAHEVALEVQRAEGIIERMGDAHCILDREFFIRKVNAAAERLLGQSRAALIGRSHWEAFPASVDAPIGHTLRRVVNEGTEQHLTHHYTGEGYDLYLEVDAYPTDEGGVAMFWRDVTEKTKADFALRVSEEKYRTLFESLEEGYVLCEVLLDDHGQPKDLFYLDANSAAKSLIGQNFIGQSLHEIGPDDQDYWSKIVGRVAYSGRSEQFEYYLSSRRIWLDFSVFKVETRPEQHWVAVIFQDITARKEAEERQAFLLRLSDALRPLADSAEMERTAARLLGEQLGVSRAFYATVDPDGKHWHVRHDYADGVPSCAGRHPLSGFQKARLDDWQAGRLSTICDSEADPALSPSDRVAYAAFDSRAAIGVPLVKGGRFSALLSVNQKEARDWSDAELTLVSEVAERTWAAIDRARAEQALHELNRTLERRVEERTHRLEQQNLELAARTRALEALAQVTHDLSLEADRFALIRRVQEIVLALLPAAHTGYFELEENVWRMRSEAGELRNEGLREQLLAGIPFESPGPFVPFTTRRPKFIDALRPGQDVPSELSGHIHSTAALPILVRGEPIGILAVGLFDVWHWPPMARMVLETLTQQLGLVLERTEAVRELNEERESLAAFARFTELAAGVTDVSTLARRAAEVLHAVLNVPTAVYFELQGGRWRGRYLSGAVAPELGTAFREGVPEEAPSFALVVQAREPLFFEPWSPVADGIWSGPDIPLAVARYPLFPQDGPVGILGMAKGRTDQPDWTEREKAVFRAVGDSFRLALERATRIRQVELHRERLTDLNNELAGLITRTAHNLEVPVGYLSRFLEADRPEALLSELSPHSPAMLKDELARLRGVSQDLRQLARLEDQPLNLELLPLSELFGEVRDAAPERVDWWMHDLAIVRGDRALLRQALDVLLTFTFSETRGTRTVEVGSQDVAGELWVTVQDDGVGLGPEEASTLFDLAVRSEQPIPLLEGGGLMQVRRVMARHGGWAWAEPRLSGGKIVLAFPRDEGVSELEALLGEGL